MVMYRLLLNSYFTPKLKLCHHFLTMTFKKKKKTFTEKKVTEVVISYCERIIVGFFNKPVDPVNKSCCNVLHCNVMNQSPNHKLH